MLRHTLKQLLIVIYSELVDSGDSIVRTLTVISS